MRTDEQPDSINPSEPAILLNRAGAQTGLLGSAAILKKHHGHYTIHRTFKITADIPLAGRRSAALK